MRLREGVFDEKRGNPGSVGGGLGFVFCAVVGDEHWLVVDEELLRRQGFFFVLSLAEADKAEAFGLHVLVVLDDVGHLQRPELREVLAQFLVVDAFREAADEQLALDQPLVILDERLFFADHPFALNRSPFEPMSRAEDALEGWKVGRLNNREASALFGVVLPDLNLAHNDGPELAKMLIQIIIRHCAGQSAHK